jgi:hypothetical protein
VPLVASRGSVPAFGFGLGAFLAAGGDFESIATVTVGSGGAANIEFTSIPSTYQHLQIRMIHKDSRSGVNENNGSLRINGDTGSNYAYHRLYGDGSSAAADGGGTQNKISAIGGIGQATATVFGAAVIDILDYASTTKNKTVRSFTGVDRNGGGYVLLDSGVWLSTSAVTSLTLYSDGSGVTWAQHSTAALYGVKS